MDLDPRASEDVEVPRRMVIVSSIRGHDEEPVVDLEAGQRELTREPGLAACRREQQM